MFWPKNKKTVAVHSGNFHADDVFAVAALSLYLGDEVKIFRTRDESVFSKADYVFDVGKEYDSKKNKFDHHQLGGAGKRANGIPYASFGLVWKEFGEKITGSKEGAEIIEEELVAQMDADDNAFEISSGYFFGTKPYTISDYIKSKNSVCEDGERDKSFSELVDFAKDLIMTEVRITKKFLADSKKVEEIYLNTADKRLIVLDGDYNWSSLSNYPEPLFVVKPSPDIGKWKVYTVHLKGEVFKNRLDLPEAWASKRDEELVKITGVSDAIYCHHSRYMAIAGSKSGAVKMAELALKELDNK